MSVTLEWEEIDPYHWRAKVRGGWLVKAMEDVSHDLSDTGMRSGWDFRVAMAFVPDPEHLWGEPS